MVGTSRTKRRRNTTKQDIQRKYCWKEEENMVGRRAGSRWGSGLERKTQSRSSDAGFNPLWAFMSMMIIDVDPCRASVILSLF